MSRILAELIPLLLPFLLYGLYVWHARRTGRGGPGATPWFWLAATGMTLMIATLIVGGLLFGEEPGKYIPARFENGKILPGRVE